MFAISTRARHVHRRFASVLGARRAWALVALLAWTVARADPAALTVTNADGEVKTYTLEALAGMPTVTVRAGNDHQEPAEYTGVELHELLLASGVAQGKELRGRHMSEYALVVGRDGYKILFSLAELDPAFAQRKIFVAFKKDGQPLPEKEAPLRVIIPDETHPTRWIRQVSSIRVGAAPEAP